MPFDRFAFAALAALWMPVALLSDDSARPTAEKKCPRGQRVFEGKCLLTPTLRDGPSPVFPERARTAGKEALVRLEAIIEADGSVPNPVVKGCTTPGYGFEEAAAETVKRWRYWPAKLDGENYPVYFTVKVNFRLNGSKRDKDRDKDGVPERSDNCPSVPNATQLDSDGNGIGDACEPTP